MSKSRKSNNLNIVHPHAAGVDIGSRFHVAAIGPNLTDDHVKSFLSYNLI